MPDPPRTEVNDDTSKQKSKVLPSSTSSNAQTVCFGLKMPLAIVVMAIVDFLLAVVADDACRMDDAMKSAKALVRLLDCPTHAAYIRDIRVHIQNFAAQ